MPPPASEALLDIVELLTAKDDQALKMPPPCLAWESSLSAVTSFPEMPQLVIVPVPLEV